MREPTRFQGCFDVRISQDIDEIECPLAEQKLRIDGQPAARSAVEHISVVQVSMQDHAILLRIE